METFRPQVIALIESSNSANTWLAYENGLKSFQNFRSNYHLENSWPCPIDHIVNYIAYMYKEGYSPSTVKTYISGIGFYLKIQGFLDLTSSFIIQKMLRGMLRLDRRFDCRRPITLDILIRLLSALGTVCSSLYEVKLFRAAFSVAFFAFLRIGEMAVYNNNKNVVI